MLVILKNIFRIQSSTAKEIFFGLEGEQFNQNDTITYETIVCMHIFYRWNKRSLANLVL